MQIFSHLNLQFAKSAFMNPKFVCVKNITMGIKNAVFYADFKFLDAHLKELSYEVDFENVDEN
jgi:hypothetical protein